MDKRVTVDENGLQDEPWELPAGWCWATIGAIGHLRGEKVDPKTAPDLPFVGMDDIANEGLRVLRTKPFSEMKSAGNRFQPGDILYGRLRPYLNKTAIAEIEGAASGELLAIKTPIEPKFLQLFLHSRLFVNMAMSTVSGDRPRIDFSTIAMFNFPLAPLPEQRRIVERIDTLFAEIAEGEAALEAARKGLETFRRALLKAAVIGELTRDWRETNRPAETGHDLLARIKAEREATSSKGRAKRAEAREPLDTSDLPELPEGWAWATIGELFGVSTGSTPSRSDEKLWNGGIPWVSSGEVAFCRIRHTKETISVAGLGNATTRLHPPGTVLLAMIGEGKTRGQCAILDVAAANNQNCAAIRVALTPIPPEFVYTVLEQQYSASRMASQGGNQPALNAAKVSNLRIPIPSLDEMDAILSIVSKMKTAIEDTFVELNAAAADATRLRQAILKSAFEGTLVPQDPADEPASVMLARLEPPAKVNKARRRQR